MVNKANGKVPLFGARKAAKRARPFTNARVSVVAKRFIGSTPEHFEFSNTGDAKKWMLQTWGMYHTTFIVMNKDVEGLSS